MRKILLLLAGPPGTGKTYLAKKVVSVMEDFQLISPDEIKEFYWETEGFKSIQEKYKLVVKAWRRYYSCLENGMRNEAMLMSDYPFSLKQKNRLQSLAERYGYCVITVQLRVRLEVAYQRQYHRNTDNLRHPGHICSCYYVDCCGNVICTKDAILSFDEFKEFCIKRDYIGFQLGKLIELDVNDFTKIDYMQFIGEIQDLMNCNFSK